MTRASAVGPAVVAVAWALGIVSSCVVPDSIGDSCDETTDCIGKDLVCLFMDPEEQADAVCVPMLVVDAPVACVTEDDCYLAHFPVDARCLEGVCSCVDVDQTCDQTTGFVRNVETCACEEAELVSCSEDLDCPGANVCVEATCRDGRDGAPCLEDEDCPNSTDGICGTNSSTCT